MATLARRPARRSLAIRSARRRTPLPIECRDEFSPRARIECEIMNRDQSLGLPSKQGLYDPAHEKDSCGVGFVAHVKGHRSHDIIRDASIVLCNMDHRGACGSEKNTGDGAG